MSDNWDQVDAHTAQMLALSTKLYRTKAKCVLFANVVANSNNNSNNKGTGRPGSSSCSRDGAHDWKYVTEGDTNKVKGRTAYSVRYHILIHNCLSNLTIYG